MISIRSQNRHVLNSAPAETGDIYAGFNGDHVAAFKDKRRTGRNPGLFVNKESNAVAKAVAEAARKTGVARI